LCHNAELEPTLQLFPINGIDLAVWEWPGEGTPLVFAHATGFHGRLWDPVIGLLQPRHALAIDMRGHGRSSKPEPPCRWRNFGADLAALVRHLNLRDAVAIGHSSGGYAVALAAALAPECFRALLLVDPTILPPEAYTRPPFDGSFALRRKNHWHSPDEMWQRFHDRVPFASWRPEALRAYCNFGLLPHDEHQALACPPAWEASIYNESNSPATDIYPDLPRIQTPATVLRASVERRPGVFDLRASPTAPDLAAKLRHGRDLVAEGHSHYIPMEAPELVAELIRSL